MKIICTLLILFFITISTFSQSKNFSAEANYPLVLSNNYKNYHEWVGRSIESLSGVFGLSFQYRFIKKEFFNYGVSFTVDHLKGSIPFDNQTTGNFIGDNESLNFKYSFYHVNGFAELIIPTVKRFHPFASIGLTYLNLNYQSLEGINDLAKSNLIETDSGFNLKFGFKYDITKSIYVQSHFHYIKTTGKRYFYSTGKIINETYSYSSNQAKFGLGFRF